MFVRFSLTIHYTHFVPLHSSFVSRVFLFNWIKTNGTERNACLIQWNKTPHFINFRILEIHKFYNLQLFYWHFLEILWLFIFLVFYLLFSGFVPLPSLPFCWIIMKEGNETKWKHASFICIQLNERKGKEERTTTFLFILSGVLFFIFVFFALFIMERSEAWKRAKKQRGKQNTPKKPTA